MKILTLELTLWFSMEIFANLLTQGMQIQTNQNPNCQILQISKNSFIMRAIAMSFMYTGANADTLLCGRSSDSMGVSTLQYKPSIKTKAQA